MVTDKDAVRGRLLKIFGSMGVPDTIDDDNSSSEVMKTGNEQPSLTPTDRHGYRYSYTNRERKTQI